MKNASKLSPGKRVSAEQIARMAERGIDVSRFFSNTGKMVRPMQRLNVDSKSPSVEESSESSQKRLKSEQGKR